jgi:prepilin-type N-terminal cleavage/methylation domain-containing protein
MNARRPSGAFTMIELMIALTILSIVIVAIYSSWTAILRGSKVALDTAAEVQRTRMAVRALEDSLLTAQVFAANIDHYSFIADTSETFAFLSMVSHLPPSFPGSGMFGNQPIRRVTFSVEPGKHSPNELVMTQMPVLLATEEGVEPYSMTLARNVTEFMIEFWDLRNQEWLPELTTTNQLPRMVRVTLGLGHPSNRSTAEIVSRVIAIPAMIVPREVQIPVGAPPGRANPNPPAQQQPGQFE